MSETLEMLRRLGHTGYQSPQNNPSDSDSSFNTAFAKSALPKPITGGGGGGETSWWDSIMASLGGGGEADGKGSGGLMDGIFKGTGALNNIASILFGMKNYGLAKQGLNHQIGYDTTQINNDTALAQTRLTDQYNQKVHERPDLYGNQQATQLATFGKPQQDPDRGVG